MDAVPALAEPGSGWSARLELGYAPRHGRTVLVHRRHEGPLLVQSSFHPEGPVNHTYVLHPPGGVVGGDTLRIDGVAHAGAHALLTTPAATKIYRSAGAQSRVDAVLKVSPGAALEWLPQETLAFAGAEAHLRTRVDVAPGARFLGFEALSLGRPASGQGFDRGCVRQDLELWCDGSPRLVERNRFEAGSPLLREPWGLAEARASATLVLFPCEDHLLEAARETLAASQVERAGATAVDGVLVCRATGPELRALRTLLERLWQTLRPRLLARPAVAPRIWAT